MDLDERSRWTDERACFEMISSSSWSGPHGAGGRETRASVVMTVPPPVHASISSSNLAPNLPPNHPSLHLSVSCCTNRHQCLLLSRPRPVGSLWCVDLYCARLGRFEVASRSLRGRFEVASRSLRRASERHNQVEPVSIESCEEGVCGAAPAVDWATTRVARLRPLYFFLHVLFPPGSRRTIARH